MNKEDIIEIISKYAEIHHKICGTCIHQSLNSTAYPCSVCSYYNRWQYNKQLAESVINDTTIKQTNNKLHSKNKSTVIPDNKYYIIRIDNNYFSSYPKLSKTTVSSGEFCGKFIEVIDNKFVFKINGSNEYVLIPAYRIEYMAPSKVLQEKEVK